MTARVVAAVDIAVAVMLEEPAVNRAVMAWLGTATPVRGEVLAHSTRLWAAAIGDDAGRSPAASDTAELLAYGFRGVLSFWTAGEITDELLRERAGLIAGALVFALPATE